MHTRLKRTALLILTAVTASVALAADNPAQERQELMEGVRDAAKIAGGMLQGKRDYDAAEMLQALQVWKTAGERLGGLFPEGSQGGEAAPAIWEDRAGFEEALGVWRDATAAAIAAAPADLDAARPAVGPAFNACKNCHDSYRIEDD